MQQTKKMNYPKPPLKLTEQDLLNKKLHKTKKFAVNFKADLLAVFQYLIKYEETLNIDLDLYEYSTNCRTYRCVGGWWAYWVGIPVMVNKFFCSSRFNNIFCNENLFLCFEQIIEYDDDGECISMRDLFFAAAEYGTLPERRERAKKLKVLKRLKK